MFFISLVLGRLTWGGEYMMPISYVENNCVNISNLTRTKSTAFDKDQKYSGPYLMSCGFLGVRNLPKSWKESLYTVFPGNLLIDGANGTVNNAFYNLVYRFERL